MPGEFELRLAAKAAGLRPVQVQQPGLDGQPYGIRVFDDSDARRGPFIWNPRHDGDDALRLARKLAMCVSFWPRDKRPSVMVGWATGRGTPEAKGHNVEIEYGEDPDAATREAIFRAAVEIGRTLA